MDILNYLYCIKEEDIIVEENCKYSDEIITHYEAEYLNRLVDFYVINDEQILEKETSLRLKHNNVLISSMFGYCQHSFFGTGLIIDKADGVNLQSLIESEEFKHNHKKINIIKELINLYDFQNSRNFFFCFLTLKDIIYNEKTEKLNVSKFPLTKFYYLSSKRKLNFDVISCDELVYIDLKMINKEKDFDKYTESWNMGLLIYEIIEGKQFFSLCENLIKNKKKNEILNFLSGYTDKEIVEKINLMDCNQLLKSLLKKTIKINQNQRACTKIVNETFSQKLYNQNKSVNTNIIKDSNHSLINFEARYHFMTESNNNEVSLIDFSKDDLNSHFNKFLDENKVNNTTSELITETKYQNILKNYPNKEEVNSTCLNPTNLNSEINNQDKIEESNYNNHINETSNPLLESEPVKESVSKIINDEALDKTINVELSNIENNQTLLINLNEENENIKGTNIKEIVPDTEKLSPVIGPKSASKLLIPSSMLIELESLAKEYFVEINKEESNKKLTEIEKKIFCQVDENTDLNEFFLGMSEVLWEVLMCLAFRLLENEEYKNHSIIANTLNIFYDKIFPNNEIKLAITKYHFSKSIKEYKGNYNSSLNMVEEAISLMNKNNQIDNPLCLQMRFFYGNLLDELGKHDDSINELSSLLKVQIELYTENHILPARTFNCLGIAEDNRSNYKQAKEYYEKSLSILHILYNDRENMDLAKVLNNLAGIYYKWEDFTYSCKLYLKVLNIYKKFFDENNLSMAIIYNNLGNCFTMLCDNKKSLDYLKKASDIFASNLGISHPQTAMTNKNLGDLYLNYDKKELAKEKYELCVNTFLEVYGEDSDFYISTSNKLKKLKLYSEKIDLN